MSAPLGAHARGLHRCHVCALACESADVRTAHCPRCLTPLHHDTRLALQRTWAYLLAAAVLYVPANVLPVMSTARLFGGSEQHTILGGIRELWQSGSWALALIVFIASIAVPLLKMGALALLTATAGRGASTARAGRTGLYRLVEAVGHWSMLDVFVVVLLVAMVRFGALASVQPEPGLLAFGAVVALTMLASDSFDPRLIWNRHPDD